MEIILLILVIQGLVFGFFCSYIAREKNRDSASWFCLGFAFSILAVLALIAVPKRDATPPSSDSTPSFKPHPIFPYVSGEKIEDEFKGERDITSLPYQLFLTKKFDIEKNLTLEKFVIGQDVFHTLDDSLNEAHTRYESDLLAKFERSEKVRLEAISRNESLLLLAAQKQKDEEGKHVGELIAAIVLFIIAAVSVIIYFTSATDPTSTSPRYKHDGTNRIE